MRQADLLHVYGNQNFIALILIEVRTQWSEECGVKNAVQKKRKNLSSKEEEAQRWNNNSDVGSFGIKP